MKNLILGIGIMICGMIGLVGTWICNCIGNPMTTVPLWYVMNDDGIFIILTFVLIIIAGLSMIIKSYKDNK